MSEEKDGISMTVSESLYRTAMLGLRRISEANDLEGPMGPWLTLVERHLARVKEDAFRVGWKAADECLTVDFGYSKTVEQALAEYLARRSQT